MHSVSVREKTSIIHVSMPFAINISVNQSSNQSNKPINES